MSFFKNKSGYKKLILLNRYNLRYFVLVVFSLLEWQVYLFFTILTQAGQHADRKEGVILQMVLLFASELYEYKCTYKSKNLAKTIS